MKALILALLLLTGQARAVAPSIYWPLSAGTAAAVGDSTYDLTMNGTVNFLTVAGEACAGTFNPSNFFSSTAVEIFLAANKSSYQLEFHVYMSSISSVETFCFWSSTAPACAGDVEICNTGGFFYYQLPPAVGCIGGTVASPSNGNWHSYIVASDGATVWTYLDNALVSTVVSATYPTASAFKIGKGNAGQLVHGYVRDIAFYAGNNCAGTATCADYVPAISTQMSPYLSNSVSTRMMPLWWQQ